MKTMNLLVNTTANKLQWKNCWTNWPMLKIN